MPTGMQADLTPQGLLARQTWEVRVMVVGLLVVLEEMFVANAAPKRATTKVERTAADATPAMIGRMLG